MTWIDYKKPGDFVPHSWVNECIELFETEDKVRNALERVWSNVSYRRRLMVKILGSLM